LFSTAVDVVAVLAAFTAWAGACVLAARKSRAGHSIDETSYDLRKLHVNPTSRVGGIAVAGGMIAGALFERALHTESNTFLLLLLCAAPAFAWGLIEDLLKRGAVLVRLTVTAASAMLAFFVLDARITELDVPLLDRLLLVEGVAFVLTVFALTGVANAMNVIDGLNGLSGVTGVLASIGLAVVAWINGDPFVSTTAVVLASSLGGFLLVNFPKGRIFLGDGGAYFVGLLLAVLSVLLVHRNSEVSPWFPLVLVAYPVWETLFSVYRRRMRGASPGRADALHLHTLVYRRVVRWYGFQGSARDYAMRNSIASACLWVLPAACLGIALLFWDNSLVLQFAAAVFAATYMAAYLALVRFRVPSWMVIRKRPQAGAEALPDDLHAVNKTN
jgi:UDP-N-acetylmuramyl pentapeptide phosphotransferase/UDP-N-acetylglucosamine-1-phosphate transferase